MAGLVRIVAAASAFAGCGRVGFEVVADAPSDAPPVSTPMLVKRAGTANVSVTSISVTLASAPVPGNVLVLVGAAHLIRIATPTGGTTSWVRAAVSSTFPNEEIWFGVADGADPTITIEIGPATPTGMTLWVGEWVGLATPDPLDVATARADMLSPADPGPITTIADRDLVIFAVNAYLPNTFGVPTGGPWTELDTEQGDSLQTVWSRLTTSAGIVDPSVSETQHRWDAAIAAFRIAP